jgi:uncharacterized caspase-like protein
VQSMLMRIILILTVLYLFIQSSLPAAAEQRTALVIGNSAYNAGPLKNPVNDATDMAAILQRLGFQVNLKKNATLETMEEAIGDFGNRLKKGGVGLFYYAGHGVQVNGVNYLIPVDSKINKESDVRYRAVDAGRILDEMANANNGMNIVLLDACRDNPFGKSFRSASRGLAIMRDAPTGTFISYSTGAGQVARDGEGENSPYTKAVLQYIQEPGTPITDVFMKVRQQLRKETGQVPWELSSLEGKFFFAPGVADKTAEVATGVELDAEKRAIELERERLRKEKKLLEQKEALQDDKQKLQEKKQQLSMGKPYPASKAKEIKRDVRFIAYGDGTVLDTKTNLMWRAKDNGVGINWSDAKSYCENYRGGGYSDWRMPTQDELAGLYDIANTYTTDCGRTGHLTEMIRITCTALWAAEVLGSTAALYGFEPGKRYWAPQSRDNGTRALPVRSVK